MKTEVVQFVFAALVLVFGGAAEELLPKVLGVGFPVLLSATLLVSARASAPAALLFALAAGALEDALCGLPAATGIGFFTLAALACRAPVLQLPALGLGYPLFQAWLWLWMPALNGSVFNRILLSLPLGALTAAATGLVLAWLGRKAVLDAR